LTDKGYWYNQVNWNMACQPDIQISFTNAIMTFCHMPAKTTIYVYSSLQLLKGHSGAD